MSFKDMMLQDAKNVFLNLNEHADTITYNDKLIGAVIELGEESVKGNTFSSDGSSSRAAFWVSSVDVELPEQGDEIKITTCVFVSPAQLAILQGISWQVARLLESGGGMHKVECLARESPFA